MRGGNQIKVLQHISDLGLSPHARGKLLQLNEWAGTEGPIPACAGETGAQQVRVVVWGAYPRMRGGNLCMAMLIGFSRGLSPHARGKQHMQALCEKLGGPIPACAGETSVCQI